jgi:hypothetical protein
VTQRRTIETIETVQVIQAIPYAWMLGLAVTKLNLTHCHPFASVD